MTRPTHNGTVVQLVRLFGAGVALLILVLAPSSGGFGFLVALVAGLLLAGGLDLIIQRRHS